ncbi:MAG: phage integrase N-terminal SAM-like domain-containing protein [Thiolinea sp.]
MTRKHTTRPADPPTPYSHEFWENYTLFLVKQGINKNYVEWYVFRTKQYIALFPDQNIRTHTDKHVEQYFHKLGQNTRIKSWQFAQAIGAIQLLFSKALKAKWANDFDWEYWKASAKQLEVDHVTVARDYTDPLADLDEPLSGEERCPPELYERYQPFLAEVIKVVRLKNYAMKQEWAEFLPVDAGHTQSCNVPWVTYNGA